MKMKRCLKNLLRPKPRYYTQRRPHLIVVEYNTAAVIDKNVQPYLIGKGYQVLAVMCWNIIATDRLEEDYFAVCPRRQQAGKK